MKVKIRENFCETDGFIVGPRDSIVITLNKIEIELLQGRGFVTDLSFPSTKIFIEKRIKKSKYE